MTEIPVPALFHLGSLGAGPSPHPRVSKGGYRSKTREKKRGRETLVMDKPVVSVGEPGGEGAVVGVGR